MGNVEQRKLHPVLTQYAIYRRIAPRARLMAPPVAIISLDSVKVAPIRGELEFQAWYAFALEQFKDKGDSLPSFKAFTDAWQNHPALWTAFASTRLGFSTMKAITAETLFTKVLSSNPDYRPAFDSLTEMYSFVGDFTKAVNLFRQYPHFAQLYPEEAIRHAIMMTELGRGDEAIVEAEKGMPQESGNTVLIDRLTRALVRRGFISQARALVDRVIAREPKNPDLLAIAARVACDQGDCTAALKLTEEGLDIESDHRALRTERGRAMFDSGDIDGGLKQLEDAATEEVGNADGLLYLSRRMAQQNKDQVRAQDFARQAVLASPMYKRANINLAYVYLLTGRPELARGAAQTALKQYPHDAEAYFLLGKALATENKPEAKEMLQAAVQNGLIGEPLKEAQTLLQRM
jgi:predicted Zn-dependent protease